MVGDVCPTAVARQVRAGIRDYCSGFDRQRNGYRMACKPLTGSRQGFLAGLTTPQLLDPTAAGAGVPSRGQAACPGLSLVACLVGFSAGTCRTALRNALGARGVKLVAALDAPSGDRCSPAHRKTGAAAGGGQHFSRRNSLIAALPPGQERSERGSLKVPGVRVAAQRARSPAAKAANAMKPSGEETVPDQRGRRRTCKIGPGRSARR
jgi:hypothetical protein